MPLYDFLCEDCDATFEELVKNFDDVGEVRCSKCGSRKVTRQLAVFATGQSHHGTSRPASVSSPRTAGGGCGSGCGCHS